MKKMTRMFAALFVFLFILGFLVPLISFAEEAVVAAAIPVPQTGIWFIDIFMSMVPALTPALLALFAGGKVWAFLFSISKPITMFTSTQIDNPSGNKTLKAINTLLLVLNYISLNIFNDKNHDHPKAVPVPEGSVLPAAKGL